jgi:hypothetical protein
MIQLLKCRCREEEKELNSDQDLDHNKNGSLIFVISRLRARKLMILLEN